MTLTTDRFRRAQMRGFGMGFLDDIKNKAADLAETVKDKLDTDNDGDVDTADATHAFDSLEDKATGGGDAPADEVAAAPGAGGAAGAAGGAGAAGAAGAEEATGDPTIPSAESVSDTEAGPLAEPAAEDALGDQGVTADPLGAAAFDTAPVDETAADAAGDLGVSAPDLIGDEDAALADPEPADAADLGGAADVDGTTGSAGAAKDEALADLQAKAEDLRSDNP
jgi:hypothetical protein